MFSHLTRLQRSSGVVAARRILAVASQQGSTLAKNSCALSLQQGVVVHRPTVIARSFASTLPPDDPQATFRPRPPRELTLDMARGIQTANQLILKHGVGQQRLVLLSQQEPPLPLVQKWQRMMEIYLGAQLHVIASLGYETNEQGIMMYTQQLSSFIGQCNSELQDEFRTIGRETWRDMLATAFQLDEDAILPGGEEMSIVDARNTVHKVASKLMEPKILEKVAEKCGKLPHRKY